MDPWVDQFLNRSNCIIIFFFSGADQRLKRGNRTEQSFAHIVGIKRKYNKHRHNMFYVYK